MDDLNSSVMNIIQMQCILVEIKWLELKMKLDATRMKFNANEIKYDWYEMIPTPIFHFNQNEMQCIHITMSWRIDMRQFQGCYDMYNK